jgi:hypothetical protein
MFFISIPDVLADLESEISVGRTSNKNTINKQAAKLVTTPKPISDF